MIIKQVKEYGKKSPRLKIDINKTDGFAPGSEVAILPTEEYNQLIQDNQDLTNQITAKDSELEVLKNQEINLKQIVEDNTAPIHQFYKEELKKKDNKIEQLEMQLKELETKTNDFKLDLMGLNGFELLILRNHKKRIRTFDADLKLIGSDPKTYDATAVPGNDRSSTNQEQ